MSRRSGRQLLRLALQVLKRLLRNRGRPSTGMRPPRRQEVDFPFKKSAPTSSQPFDRATTAAPTPDAAREYRMPAGGLPPLSYSPNPNGRANPGEVVWAWVPYEEDPSQGKDRPVLVISEVTGGFLAVQMTSKDHSRDRAREEHFGRHWLEIGSGPWDSQGRESEVRLDRLLFLPPAGVRREGATLPKERFREVAQALVELHR